MAGASFGELHRSHLPLLDPDVRAAVLADNRSLTGPGGSGPANPTLLRSYQKDGADFIRGRHGSILAYTMGLGKTRTSLVGTYAPDKIGIIVAPLVAWSVWKREIAVVYGPDYPVTEVTGRTLTEDNSLTKPGIYILNPEIVRDRFSEWYAIRPEFVILDEAHLYVNRHTRRHEGAQSLVTRANHRVALTGTPILRHLVDLHGILRCVVAGAFGGWREFALELGGQPGKHGGVQLGAVPQAACDRLEARLAEIMLRKRWEEVASFVPPITRERLDIQLSAADAAEYNRLASDVRRVLGPRVSYDELMAAAKMIEIGALRRFIGRAKIPAVVDLVCSTNEPVVVWTWHKDVARSITAAVNKREGSDTALVVTGDEKRTDRDQKIERFQQGGARVICCTIGAAGIGIDFTVSRFTVNAEQSWTPADMAQTEARVWRTNQTKPCHTYWPLVRGSIEERVLEVLESKEKHAKEGVLAGIAAAIPTSQEVLDSIVDLVDMVVSEK